MGELSARRICVTGAGGFIGAPLVRRLDASGASVAALVGLPGDTCTEPPARVRSARGRIDLLEELLPLVKGCDAVVHLAGPSAVSASFADPVGFAQAHTVGTAVVLEACRKADVARLVYVSSAEVYGVPHLPRVPESAELQARSPYAAAKIGAERLVEAMTHATALQAVVLRPFSVYGPGSRPNALVPTILRQATGGDVVELFDPNVVRDYCYVDDLTEAIERACSAALPGLLSVFNVGTGVGVSAGDLALEALKILGRRIPVRAKAVADRPRDADIRQLVSDPSRAQQELGWRATTTLEGGLRQTLDWMRACEF